MVESRLKSFASDQMASWSTNEDWKPTHCSMKGTAISRKEVHVARNLEMCKKDTRGRSVGGGGKLCVFSTQAGNASRHPVERLRNNWAFELLKQISKRF